MAPGDSPVLRRLTPEQKIKPFADIARDMRALVDPRITGEVSFRREEGIVVTMTLGKRRAERAFDPNMHVSLYQQFVLDMAGWLADEDTAP